MTLRYSLPLGITLLLAPTLLAADNSTEEAVTIYRSLRPSVVGIKHAEGSGTGVLIDDKGLILTNAHVIDRLLPLTVTVEAPSSSADPDDYKTYTFKKVRFAGIHPRFDLALVRIDPAEHPIPLRPAKLSRTRAVPGRRVYAIGNPGLTPDVILTKTITSGMISGFREIAGQPMYQISAPINPGNSGGPLCDHTGHVIALVTAGFDFYQNVGFAIPLDRLDTSQFVDSVAHNRDPAQAAQLLRDGLRLQEVASEYEKITFGRSRTNVVDFCARAAALYQGALAYDTTNPDTYVHLGTVLNTFNPSETSATYLVRALQISPWYQSSPKPYFELGYALARANKLEDARVAWTEGLAKYPDAGLLWAALATYYKIKENYPEAAYAASVARQVGTDANPRGFTFDIPVTALRRDACARLSAEQLESLNRREADMMDNLTTAAAQADAALAARKLYLTPAFAALIKRLGGPDYPHASDNLPASRIPQAIPEHKDPLDDLRRPGLLTPIRTPESIPRPTTQPTAGN